MAKHTVKGTLSTAFKVVSGIATATFGNGDPMEGFQAADYLLLKGKVAAHKLRHKG